MSAAGQSERVRGIVIREYVQPAVEAGEAHVSIRAGDVLKRAEATEGFPRARTPLVCNVLQSRKLLDEGGLEIERVEGPPSKQSRRVVVHYRVIDPTRAAGAVTRSGSEAPEERVRRAREAFEELRGLMKGTIEAHGGAEAFIRWVRSDSDEDAA